MYNYKTTFYGDALVALFLSAITNSVGAYGSLVVGMDIYNVWDLCGMSFWSLWETSCLISLGDFFMQSLNLIWFSGYTCPRPCFFMEFCRCMLRVLVAFNEMTIVPLWLIFLRICIGP
jgi:hypothetical protein